MKVTEESFLVLKLDTLQRVMEVQDEATLQKVMAVLLDEEPTPQYLLDLIKRGQAESKAGLCRPVEELLEEMKNW